MAKFRLTQKAVEDLENSWNYTCENWSESQADSYYQLLAKNFQNIANKPNIGKEYAEIAHNLKGYHISKHRETESCDIEIIRILHEQMDVKSRISDR